MKFALLFLAFSLTVCSNLRSLGLYPNVAHNVFTPKLEELGDKQLYYAVTNMECPKYVKYFLRGSLDQNADYQEEIKKEMKEKYPEDVDKCIFKIIGGGKIRSEGKTVFVKGTSAKFGPSNTNLVIRLLRYDDTFKGFKFVADK